MATNPLTAKPVAAFSLGKKRILVCDVIDINPHQFLGKEFIFNSLHRQQGRIKIEGLSTGSQFGENLCDFSYSGAEISPDQIGADSQIIEMV